MTEAEFEPSENGVVVGVDGSTAASLAATWAAREAHVRGTRLAILNAAHKPHAIVSGMAAYTAFRDAANADLEPVLAPLREQFPDVQTRTLITEGNTVPVLVDAARRARLLVLARRPRGPLAVGAGYAVDGALAHSRTPVAVVPTD